MSFDRLAPHYTWMEAVLAGRRLKRARNAWLEGLAGCRDILIAGVGHGHFLRRCLAAFPAARITSVDASAPMLAAAERRARGVRPNLREVEFVHATLPDWEPRRAGFDAIVTHFFLDCFAADELDLIVRQLSAAARPRAQWLLADFHVPPHGLARRRAMAVHAMMYAFFRRVAKIRARRVVDPGPWLRDEGFSLVARRQFEWGLLQSDWWSRRD